ncbi:MAG: hypothetical protein RLN85_08380, partial [Pseudomonadales bacterium]
MKSLSRLVLCVFLATVPAGSASAQDQSAVPILSFPESFLVGRAPGSVTSNKAASPASESTQSAPEKEGAAALNGSLYAVIAPIFDGVSGTLSFVRLINGGAATSTFSVTVVGSPSGTAYGTANISVPTRASPQFSLPDIIAQAGVSGLSGGDTE